jgi:hypothetical protein
MDTLTRLIQVASVGTLGIFAGAMLLIATAQVPYWKSLSPEEYRTQFKAIGPFLGKAMVPLMLTAILLAGLNVAVNTGTRLPWAIATGLVLAIVPLYAAVHAPVNAQLLGADSLDAVALTALRAKWVLWHGVRTALGFASLITSLVAYGWASCRS